MWYNNTNFSKHYFTYYHIYEQIVSEKDLALLPIVMRRGSITKVTFDAGCRLSNFKAVYFQCVFENSSRPTLSTVRLWRLVISS